MIIRKPHSRYFATGLLVATFTVGTTIARETGEDTRQIMHGVFDAIAYLLPLSVRDTGLSSTWDRELINAKLDVLKRSSNGSGRAYEGQDARVPLSCTVVR